MYAPFVLLIVVVVGVVVFALGMLLERRRRRRIDELVAAVRGKLIDVRPPPDYSTRRRIVRYIGPQGELRQATAVFGRAPHFEDDKPFQEVLRQTYKPPADPSCPVDINRIMRSIENAKLPGHAAFCAVVRELAAGSNDSIVINESASCQPVDRRFAPILQCIEACHIDDGSPAEHQLDFIADGKNIQFRWRVEGEAPKRSLIVEAVRLPAGNNALTPMT